MDFTRAKKNKKIDIWISILLSIILYFGINFFLAKLDFNIDITPDSKHTLSPETTTRLNKIVSPVNIFITISKNTNQPKIIQKLLHDFEIIAQSFDDLNLKHDIKVHRVNLDRLRKTSDFLLTHKISERNSIIVSSPNGNKRVIFSYKPTEGSNEYNSNKVYRSENSLAREAVWESGFYDEWKESVNGILEPTIFKGEELLLKSIIEVANPKPERNVAYFTRGHGEASPSDVDPNSGYSELRSMLENRNTIVSSIDLGTIEKMPRDAKMLIIANPKGIFQDKEISVIRNFINHDNGSLLVTLDPSEEIAIIDKPAFGLRELLKQWGIRCHDILIYDPDDRNFDVFSGDYYLRTYSRKPQHIVSKSLKKGGYSVQAEKLRPIESIESQDKKFISQELLYTSRTSWGVTSWTNRNFPPKKNVLLDVEGPLPVICISENKKQDGYKLGKIAVIGTSSILSNKKLKNNSGNRILSSNLIYWLSQNKNIVGIQTKKVPLYKLSMTKAEFEKLLYLLSIVPLTVAVIGAFVTWLRKEL